MLAQNAALQRVALLAGHRSDVERVSRLFVLWLLQLPAVDQLHVGNGYGGGFAGILVLEPAAQRREDLRPVIVERACCPPCGGGVGNCRSTGMSGGGPGARSAILRRASLETQLARCCSLALLLPLDILLVVGDGVQADPES
jgi:hypothetical protein